MTNQAVSYIDNRIEETFTQHLQPSSNKEVVSIVNRFYELYYVRGKSLQTALAHSTVGRTVINKEEFLLDLRDIVSRY